VTVRTHVPWYWRALVIVGIVMLSVALSGWAFDAGRRIAGFDRSETEQAISELRTTNTALDEEVARLRAQLTASESSLKIEQASQQILADKNNELSAENARLKEELAVFERVAKLDKKTESGVAVERLKIEHDSAGHYRFGFLISLQGARRGKEAKLSLQIVATSKEDSQNAKIVLPTNDDPNLAQYEIELKNFRRIEGRFDLPGGVKWSLFDFRILEDGVLRASQSISI
jgi:multidrug efflux pump subunit AcrA (membrane-fusion protein)